MKRIVCLIALAAWPTPAIADEKGDALSWEPVLADSAEDVAETPPRESYKPPPSLSPLSGRNLQLTPKERHGLAYGREWADKADGPARGEDGSIVFVSARPCRSSSARRSMSAI
jgi:hypothetical protein